MRRTFMHQLWRLSAKADDGRFMAEAARIASTMGETGVDPIAWLAEYPWEPGATVNIPPDLIGVIRVPVRDANMGRAPSGYYVILDERSIQRRVYGPLETMQAAKDAVRREVGPSRREQKKARARSAEQIASSLKKRAGAYHRGEVSYEELGDMNRIDWDDASRSKKVHDEVLTLLRDAPAAALT